MATRLLPSFFLTLLAASWRNAVFRVEAFSVVGRSTRTASFVPLSPSRTVHGKSIINSNHPLQLSTSLSQVDEERVAAAEDEVDDDGVTPDVEQEGDSPKQQRALQRERNTLFVGNLPFDKTDDEVRALFEPYGKVELVNLPRNKKTGEPRGFAFVDVSTPEEADAAIAGLDGAPVGTRNIRVSKSVAKPDGEKQGAPPSRKSELLEGACKLYVGNIPFETTVEEITAHYAEFGEVLEAYIPMDRNTGKGRGFAFVTMKEEDAAKALDETNGTEYQGRKLVVSVPLPPGEKAPPRKSSRVKLYVGNLSFYTIADTLIDAFSEFGTVHDCYLPEDPSTGASRGFGFVTMDKESALQAVAELDGCEIDGRKVRVNQAQPKGVSSGRSKSSNNDYDSDPELP